MYDMSISLLKTKKSKILSKFNLPNSLKNTKYVKTAIKLGKNKAPGRFELPISCLLDRRFNQLSHGAKFYLVRDIKI